VLGNLDFRKLGTFGLVGICSTLVYVGTFEGLVVIFGQSRTISNLVAFPCAAATSYFGHHTFTFRVNAQHGRYGPRFMIQMLITFLMTAVLTECGRQFHVQHTLTAITIAIAIPITGFFIMQFWVFADRPDRQGDLGGRE
jgi:putative flippase GtrA